MLCTSKLALSCILMWIAHFIRVAEIPVRLHLRPFETLAHEILTRPDLIAWSVNLLGAMILLDPSTHSMHAFEVHLWSIGPTLLPEIDDVPFGLPSKRQKTLHFC